MEKLWERYEILDKLGEGVTAQVYLVQDTLLDRKAAIKVRIGKELLLWEAKCLALFAGEFFPALYDYREEAEGCALIMEYIAGENLAQRWKRIEHYTEGEVLRIACMVAAAVDRLHRGKCPCLYGDIKPENIMMQPDGRIRLIDLGTVCPLSDAGETLRGGTPLYAPPDMWQGKPDSRSDIYSLGRLMEELLEIKKGRKVSYDVRRLIERCTPRQKEKRYGSMQEFLKEAGLYLPSCGIV